jgi:hypothetical protein
MYNSQATATPTAQQIREMLAKMSPEERAIATGADLKRLKREEYEGKRDDMVKHLVKEGLAFSQMMSNMKNDFLQRLEIFTTAAQEYAELSGKAYKGNMTLYSKDKLMKVEYAINESYSYDERSLQAEALIKECMQSLVREDENTKVLYDLVSSLMERTGKTGKMDPRQVSKLYKYEDEIQDSRFKQAIGLFKEAYQFISSKAYLRIYTRQDHKAKWEQLPLDFASV